MKTKSIAICAGTFVLLSLLTCLFLMPAINPTSAAFWFCLLVISAFSASTAFVAGKFSWPCRILGGVAGLSIVVLVLGNLYGMPIFHAARYAGMVSVQQSDIKDYNITLHDVPLLDKDSAFLLANRKMGSLVDLVSQFSLNKSDNVQINYKNQPSRVLPLQYSGFFKYVNNHANGIPGYVMVDMSTQKAELVNVKGGIHYSPSAFFFNNLLFHVYLHHPSALVDSYTFDVDDNGNPYWVIRVVKHTIGPFGGTDMKSILLVDAISGKITEYAVKDVPSWVDTVYPASMIISQYNNHGSLKNGFWNSKIGQKDVVQTTNGYNYITYNGDVYLYTGITSVVSDESNIGFIFTNLRTKETKQFTLPSAEEFSAMSSAEGQVQHLNYKATFPILVKVAGQPTYCMTLKDAGGLVKLYAMVNAESYQIVVTGASVNDTIDNYVKALSSNNIAHEPATYVTESAETTSGQTEAPVTISGVVAEIRSANISGTTYYYLQLQGVPGHFEVPATDKEIIFVDKGQSVTLRYAKADAGKPIISAAFGTAAS